MEQRSYTVYTASVASYTITVLEAITIATEAVLRPSSLSLIQSVHDFYSFKLLTLSPCSHYAQMSAYPCVV